MEAAEDVRRMNIQRIAIHGSADDVKDWAESRRSNAVQTPKPDKPVAFEDLFFPLLKDD